MRPCDGEADRAGREQAAAEPLGPAGGVALHADVEGRLAQACLGDAARGVGPVGRAPPLPQPIRDVEAHAILGREQLRPALGDAAQDGVDQLGEAVRAAIAPGRLDRQIDDGVRGHVEADELGGAGEQDRPQAALVARQRPLQEGAEHVLQLALPAQHGGRHRPRQRPVSRLQRGEARDRGRLRQHLLERPALHEHAGDEADGELARGEPCLQVLVFRHVRFGRHLARLPHGGRQTSRDRRAAP